VAGIGFELRKLLRHETYANILQAYSYAGILSAGPWVISIFGILCLNLLKYAEVYKVHQISQFQTSITYLIASSLIFSSFTQHSFTRYISDRLFQRQIRYIVPNFNGMLFLLTVASGILGFALAIMLFPKQDSLYRILLGGSFVVLCNIWLATNLLSGLKAYRTILTVFFLGYGLTIGIGYFLRNFGLDGLMIGFFVGQSILLAGMLVMLFIYYPSNRFIDFDFLRPGKIFISLVFTSLFYNLGIWIDKFIFWYYPATSHAVLGSLRVSMIYDIPIFLAYVTIIPGMAIFLFRMETDFVEYYKKYYDAIVEGGSLTHIINMRVQMIAAARRGIFEIVRIQGFFVLMVIVLGPQILNLLGISSHYVYLLNIDVIGTGLLVVFLALLNLFFYLDRRKETLILTGLFLLLNTLLTLVTLKLGIFYFGYGFVCSVLIVNILAIILINYDFKRLEYITFMRQ